MINFRFHVISLVAIFLALGVGVIMGTAVIDSAVVDRLESQQRGLEARIDDVTSENDALSRDLRELRQIDEAFADEGGPLLLQGALRATSVAIVAVKGTDEDLVADLVAQLDTADADVIAVLWLTDRLVLDDADEARDLAGVVGLAGEATLPALRTAMANRLAATLRGGPSSEAAGSVLPSLRREGFVEAERANGTGFETLPSFPAGTVAVVVGDAGADLSAEEGPVPLLRALIRTREDGLRSAPVLVAEPSAVLGKDGKELTAGLVRAVRDDGGGDLDDRVATVDVLEHMAGRLAAVLAIADLRTGKVGHYGRADGAAALIPSRVTA